MPDAAQSGTKSTAEERRLADARAEAWRTEIAAAIEEYNRFIEQNGVPLGQFRKF